MVCGLTEYRTAVVPCGVRCTRRSEIVLYGFFRDKCSMLYTVQLYRAVDVFMHSVVHHSSLQFCSVVQTTVASWPKLRLNPFPDPGISHGRPLARRDRPEGVAGPGGVARRRSMVSRLRPGE